MSRIVFYPQLLNNLLHSHFFDNLINNYLIVNKLFESIGDFPDPLTTFEGTVLLHEHRCSSLYGGFIALIFDG